MSKEELEKLEREKICGRAKADRSHAQGKAIAERIKEVDPK